MTPSQQFKPTPRFSVPRFRPNAPSPFPSTLPAAPGVDSLSQSSPATADDEPVPLSRSSRPKLSKVESIHDASQENEAASQENEAEEMLHDSLPDTPTLLVESVEPRYSTMRVVDTQLAPALDTPTWPNEEPTKRRHLTVEPDSTLKQSTSTIHMDSAKRGYNIAGLESPPRSSKVPRFRIGQTPAPTLTAAMEAPLTQSANPRPRNPFLLRPQSGAAAGDPEGVTPLPEHFSPHRRSQKFVPGGMADVVRTWLLNVGQSGFQMEAASNYTSQRMERPQRAGQPSSLRVRECLEGRPGDRLRLVSGSAKAHSRSPLDQRTEYGSSSRAILVGPPKGNLRSVKVGDDVNIATPSWEVEVGQNEEKWLVAVDWKMS